MHQTDEPEPYEEVAGAYVCRHRPTRCSAAQGSAERMPPGDRYLSKARSLERLVAMGGMALARVRHPLSGCEVSNQRTNAAFVHVATLQTATRGAVRVARVDQPTLTTGAAACGGHRVWLVPGRVRTGGVLSVFCRHWHHPIRVSSSRLKRLKRRGVRRDTPDG
jgi:hypothetical protein